MQKLISFLIVVLSTSLSFGQKIEGLNFGTFHTAGTTDAKKVEFDQSDKKNRTGTYEIAKMLAEFKPTVISVEVVPAENEGINLRF